jgi:hypothetical protein
MDLIAAQQAKANLTHAVVELVGLVRAKIVPADKALESFDRIVVHMKEEVATIVDKEALKLVKPVVEFLDKARNELLAMKNNQN